MEFVPNHIDTIPESKSELNGVLVTMYLYAPDAYDEIDDFPGAPELTLNYDYNLLKLGIEAVFRRPEQLKSRGEMLQLIETAYDEFLHGDEIKAREALLELEDLIGKT